MSNLSRAAQAVLDSGREYATQAWSDATHQRFNLGIATALRAAADQAENVHPARPSTEWGEGWLEGVQDVVASFRRIADELEALSHD